MKYFPAFNVRSILFTPVGFDILFNSGTAHLITKMKIRINNGVVLTGCILLILMFVLTTGCINSAQKVFGGESRGEISAIVTSSNPDLSGLDSGTTESPNTLLHLATPAPAPSLAVDEVSPAPYLTPDPYRLPYRDHGTWSTAEPVRAVKYPQFIKTYILRSNSTAVRVNVTQAPLVINLTYSPQWDNPDHTSVSSSVNEDGSVRPGVSVNSFVYPTAVVSVYNEGSRSVIEQDGYGKGYSTDLAKKITIYREGTYIITLSGDFINVNMAITTGAGAEKPPVNQRPSGTAPSADEEGWG